MHLHKYRLNLTILGCLLWAGAVSAQNMPSKVSVERVHVPKVTLTDTSLIKFFVQEFFIDETQVDKIDIIDATGNGFGDKDLAITYPSREIYFVFPSDTAQTIMNNWRFTANFQIVGGTEKSEFYENAESRRAENGIFAALLRGLTRNYKGDPMKIRFEKKDGSIVFEMWGYDEEKLQYSPRELPGGRDAMFIYTTVSDTLYTGK